MIKFENTEVFGWEAAIRGMRNPLNSWSKSDSYWDFMNNIFVVGDNDLDLMKRLRKAGTDHRKYLRMINVSVDITAPLYWWKEADTYHVGTVTNSCSTMHKIHAKEFTLDDFSTEHLVDGAIRVLVEVLEALNEARDTYINYDEYAKEDKLDPCVTDKKQVWWQMIQLLPSSYNQRRTVQLNYEVLNNMYHARKNHKLDEWSIGFCEWVKILPYAQELIINEN